MAHLISGLRDTGLEDQQGRRIQYEISVEPHPTIGPTAYRVWGRQVRGNRPHGRGSSPMTVYGAHAAKAYADSLYHRHLRYLERNVAVQHLRRVAAEEETDALVSRLQAGFARQEVIA